jgi:hypothetical protein
MYRSSITMHRTPTSSADWSDERIDRLARALLPIVFASNSHPQDVRRVGINNETGRSTAAQGIWGVWGLPRQSKMGCMRAPF